MNREEFDDLVIKEEIVQCPSCGSYSAYAWDDSNMDPNKHVRYENCTDEPFDVYHIGACSCFEWECGYCRKSWAPADSPIMAEVYTHVDYSDIEEW